MDRYREFAVGRSDRRPLNRQPHQMPERLGQRRVAQRRLRSGLQLAVEVFARHGFPGTRVPCSFDGRRGHVRLAGGKF